SPGWQSKASHSELRVVNLTAFAFPVFRKPPRKARQLPNQDQTVTSNIPSLPGTSNCLKTIHTSCITFLAKALLALYLSLCNTYKAKTVSSQCFFLNV